jgi:hypothetical protein
MKKYRYKDKIKQHSEWSDIVHANDNKFYFIKRDGTVSIIKGFIDGKEYAVCGDIEEISDDVSSIEMDKELFDF